MKCWPKGIKASTNSHKHCPSSFHRQITLCCCLVQLTTFMNEKELSFYSAHADAQKTDTIHMLLYTTVSTQ